MFRKRKETNSVYALNAREVVDDVAVLLQWREKLIDHLKAYTSLYLMEQCTDGHHGNDGYATW